MEQVGWDLSRGAKLNQASSRAGIPVWQISEWPVATHPQDYALRLKSDNKGWSLHVTRETDLESPSEIVEISVDETTHLWTTDPGADSFQMKLSERPRRVILDPKDLLLNNMTKPTTHGRCAQARHWPSSPTN